MRGLIGYEESQTVTMAFRKSGHDFMSCDIQPCSGGHQKYHIQDNIHNVLPASEYGFIGLHPVCRLLANSGIRWLTSRVPKPRYIYSAKYRVWINLERWAEMERAANEFKQCIRWIQKSGKGYIENPVMHPYAAGIIGMKPTQIIQPWMFGHTTKKATCLWLFGLPKLEPTNIISLQLRTDEIHKCAPGPNREKIRSKTFPGIAAAMADQWGILLDNITENKNIL